MPTEETQPGEAIRPHGIGWRGPRQALTAAAITAHPALHGCLREQSRLLLQAYEGNPRLASVFGTQQRWLLAHAALSLYFRAGSASEGPSAARLFELVTLHDVASRNTADAFLKEMIKYGYARPVPAATDRRRRPLEPTQETIDAIHGWVAVHLATLDKLDGDRRLETFLATPGALARLHPPIADGLLACGPIREPERTFSLFTWLNNGGIVMDRLIAGVEEVEPDAERIPTAVVSIAAMAQWLKVSRTHLARKLAEAEKMGSIGWQGKRGHSVMWISHGFRREIAVAQAAKLAVIDAAFAAC